MTRLAGLTLGLALLSGCTLISGPEITTTAPVDYLSRICPALSRVADAGVAGDSDAYVESLEEAWGASKDFIEEYPGNEDASILLEFTEILRDVPPGGYQGQDLAESQAVMAQVGDICGTKP